MSENPLVKAILDEAEEEKEKIIAKAKKDAEGIVREARVKAEKERGEIKSAYDSYLLRLSYDKEVEEREKRKEKGERSRNYYAQVIEEAEKELKRKLRGKEGRDILLSWLIEAIVAIDRKEVTVSYFPETPVTEELIARAKKEVEKRAKTEVVIERDGKSITEEGLIVTSKDGLISYNNSVSARIRRFKREEVKIIQEEYAEDNRNN